MTNATSSQNIPQTNPITETEYALIVQTAQSARPGETQQQATLRAATDIAAIGFMRDGLLRPGEAAEARWRDLRCEQDGSGLLTITVSKEGLGYVIYVSPRTMNALGEMHSIKQATGIDIEKDDRIFQMSGRQLTQRIRNTCSFAGLKGRYGGSSPRLGMAMDLARTGASVVRVAERWKNPAMAAHHIRNLQAATGAVAQWHARNQGRLPSFSGELVETPDENHLPEE